METIDTESIKVFGTALTLLISTAAIQYKFADFINAKRDNYPERRVGKFVTFSEFYDWLWGYLLGIAINVIFLLIACRVKEVTKSTELSLLGECLFVLYLVNLIFWIGGLFIDGLRILKYPGVKRGA